VEEYVTTYSSIRDHRSNQNFLSKIDRLEDLWGNMNEEEKNNVEKLLSSLKVS
jgi:hypothetical protein